MKNSRYTAEQFAMRQAESGTPVTEACRKIGISEQIYYRWKKKFVGMGIADEQAESKPQRVYRTYEEDLLIIRLWSHSTGASGRNASVRISFCPWRMPGRR